jgi:hypothetical protein
MKQYTCCASFGSYISSCGPRICHRFQMALPSYCSSFSISTFADRLPRLKTRASETRRKISTAILIQTTGYLVWKLEQTHRRRIWQVTCSCSSLTYDVVQDGLSPPYSSSCREDIGRVKAPASFGDDPYVSSAAWPHLHCPSGYQAVCWYCWQFITGALDSSR